MAKPDMYILSMEIPEAHRKQLCDLVIEASSVITAAYTDDGDVVSLANAAGEKLTSLALVAYAMGAAQRDSIERRKK